jgi:hypothetical protein
MKTAILRSLLATATLFFAVQANAILYLTPGGEWTNETLYNSAYPETPINNPNDSGDILSITGETADLLYKDNVGGSEEGMANFMASYETTYFNTALDPMDAQITYVGGDIMADANWLVVKDGDTAPSWYLFDISAWDGVETISLNNFWPQQGAISHISIFGSDTVKVPEPGTLALFGLGLLGLGLVRRRKS